MICWTSHLNSGPEEGPQAVVAVGGKVYSFGGGIRKHRDEGQLDVHVFNTVSLRWRRLAPEAPGRAGRLLEVPSKRWGHTAVLVEDNIYIWRGCKYNTREYTNALYGFDVDAQRWFKPRVSGTVPEGRRGHSACVLGKIMFIHGGWTQHCSFTDDIYKFDTSTMLWSVINTRGTPPPASYCHSATMIGTKMFVFGGYGGQFYNTIRVFDTETNSWMNTPSAQCLPERRGYHSAFSYKGELYIFGGTRSSMICGGSVQRASPGGRSSPRGENFIQCIRCAVAWWETVSYSSEDTEGNAHLLMSSSTS